MKGTRHNEEQIIAILKQGEAGLATAELCRQHGITKQTYYRWKYPPRDRFLGHPSGFRFFPLLLLMCHPRYEDHIGSHKLDFAIQRQFGITEKARLECRTDFFNLFNSPHFLVDGNLGNFPPLQPNPTFGAATLTVGGPREIQLALRLRF